MPNLAMAEETMLAEVNEAFRDREPILPIVWPNKEWDADVQGPHPSEGDSPWLAIHIKHDGSDQHSMGETGGRVFTRTGTLTVQVFVPLGQRGLAPSTALVMDAINTFEGKTIDGVRFLSVGPQTIGHDASWYQVNVQADFEFDEVK